MGTGTIGLIVAIAFLLILLRFVGKIIKNLILLVLFVMGSAFALWYFVPEQLDEWVGAERVDKVEAFLKQKAKEAKDDAVEYIEEKTEEVVDEAVEAVEKKVEEKIDSLKNQ